MPVLYPVVESTHDPQLYLVAFKFMRSRDPSLYTLILYHKRSEEQNSIIMNDEGCALFCTRISDAKMLLEFASSKFHVRADCPSTVHAVYDLPLIVQNVVNNHDDGGELSHLLILLLDFMESTSRMFDQEDYEILKELFGHIFDDDGKILSFPGKRNISVDRIVQAVLNVFTLLFLEGRIMGRSS